MQLTAPTAGATVRLPVTVALAATASDADDAVARVEFFAGSTLVGTDTSMPYTAAWTPAAAGSYVLTARATDSRGARTTSAGVPVTVLPPSAGGIDRSCCGCAGRRRCWAGWTVVTDATAAGGARLQKPNAGAAKLTTALAVPTRPSR